MQVKRAFSENYGAARVWLPIAHGMTRSTGSLRCKINLEKAFESTKYTKVTKFQQVALMMALTR